MFFLSLLKTDFTPIRNNGYKPRSLKFRLKANIKTSHSVLVGLVVVKRFYIG